MDDTEAITTPRVLKPAVVEALISLDHLRERIREAARSMETERCSEPDARSSADHVGDAIATLVHSLRPEERAELVALAWIGRTDSGIASFAALVENAASTDKAEATEYLLGLPLRRYLARGYSHVWPRRLICLHVAIMS